jgi:hypothetical protein
MTVAVPFGSDLKVLVLAGSDHGPARQHATASPESPLSGKAFLRLRGRLVIEYVLDVLRECDLTRIWVLAPEHHLAQIPSHHRFVPVPQQPGARFFANLSAGAAALDPQDGEAVLVAFGDHPVTSARALQRFLDRCAQLREEADFFHGLALQAPYREYAPWFSRTSVHMREMSGRASGFILAIPSRVHRLRALDRLYDVRKLERRDSMFGLLVQVARWLGPNAPRCIVDSTFMYLAKEMEKAGRGRGGPLARRLESWLAARVSLPRLERYAVRVLGAERGVRLIPIAHGGIAIDVDFAEEFAALEQHWDTVQQISARQDAALRADEIAESPG